MKMKNITKTTMPLAALAGIALAATSANAATIAHLGNEIDFGDGWRSNDEAKTNAAFDPDGDDAWGTDGYYTANLTPLLPTYISTVTLDPTTKLSTGPAYDNPSLAIGPGVADLTDVFYANDISVPADNPVSFTITLDSAADFVLTVIYDVSTVLPPYGTGEIEVSGPGGAFAETTGLAANATVDYAFFRLAGDAADVFTVTMVSSGGSGSVAAGIAFETVPEPGTFALALLGLGLIGFRRRRN